MCGGAESPHAVWSADCLESPGVGMRKSSGLTDIVEQRPQTRVRSRARGRPAPELDSLPVSHLRTCLSACCGVVLFSIVTGRFAASRLATPWRTCRYTVHVPGSGQSFPTEPLRQTIVTAWRRSVATFPASRWLAPIVGSKRKSQHRILIGREDLQNGKTKHTT